MSSATLEIIAGTLLSGDEAAFDFAQITADVDILMEKIGRLDFLDFYPALRRLPKPWARAGTRAVGRLRRSAADVVAARRADPTPREDLLAFLMAARDPETGAGLSDLELRDNINTFIGAGYETTSLALTWALYLLAHAPDWQERLAAEAEQVCGGPVRPEHLDRLPLHDAVLKEAMRLYPPAPAMDRVALADVTMGDIPVRKGDMIVLAIYPMHRSSRLWDAPHSFDPSRFLPERAADHHRFQFIPFSDGPRICVGMKLAMMEAVAVLASVLRRVRVSPAPDARPYPKSRITLRPEGGMPLLVAPRKRSGALHASLGQNGSLARNSIHSPPSG
ncbi:MAG: cytochrome P450 [Shimia sp.]